MEIQHLLTNSGFEVVRLETGEFLDEPHPEFAWVTHLLKRYNLSHDLRGDGIYAVARKGAVKNRWPAWLYHRVASMKPTAEFRNTTVRLVTGARCPSGGEIPTAREPTWHSADGWNTGLSSFRRPSGTLVVDGERAPLDLPAGGDRHFETQVAASRGTWRLLRLRFRHAGARSVVLRSGLAVHSDRRFRVRRWHCPPAPLAHCRQECGCPAPPSDARSGPTRFTLPVEIPWRNRNLIRTLVRRDILSRYAGSAGGALWAVLNPLLLMLTYFFIFGVVMHARVPGDPSATGFAFYFLAGMMPWLAFSDALARAPGILIEHRNFIRKLVFPVETLPVNLVVTGLVTEFFGIAIFLLGRLL
jgi:hypothetical protein